MLFEKIMPALLSSSSKIRCFVHACSTGKEPYTLAIMNLLYRYPLEIYAADFDMNNLSTAISGKYAEADFYYWNEKYHYNDDIVGFFQAVDGHYELSSAIRELVSFIPRRVDLRSPEDFQDLPAAEIVFCQNCLFYHPRETQRVAIDNLARQATSHLVLSGFHMDSIREDVERNGFVPELAMLEEIHDGWLIRRNELDPANNTPESYVPVGLGAIDKTLPDWQYRYASIFNRCSPA